MTALVQHLAAYRDYHRDRRNIATHAVGIPMIVLAIEILLSRLQIGFGSGLVVTGAMIVSALATLYYLRLDLRFGLAMGAILALFAWIGLEAARLPLGLWLAAGIGPFVVGWAFQLVGHGYEGRKPAFLDDLKSLLTGPLFVLAELAFAAGLRKELEGEIERAGA